MFEVMIADDDPRFAEGAARAAFEEIDRLEGELSRFSANSDIARINNLPPGGSTRVAWDTFRCLLLSAHYCKETGGAFDVTVGALVECWLAKGRSPHPSDEQVRRAAECTGMELFELDESTMTVRVGAATPLVDLGAVGKGYAVDCAAELLKEWGVASALVHGGTSSVYAFGQLGDFAGWPVTLSNPGRPAEVIDTIVLAEAGLGGSGIKKGMHILDPRRSRPAGIRRAAWVLSESAARSDALSTACMMMGEEEIRAMIARDARLRVIIAGEEGVRKFEAASGDLA